MQNQPSTNACNINAQVSSLSKKVIPQPDEPANFFGFIPANKSLQRASKRPVPKMLFGKFWYEGELCILFADSNLGKSILAVQIGNSINKGTGITPFPLEAEAQPVLYCDFELTDKQFEARYSADYANHYVFNDDFYRGELNADSDLPDGFASFEDYLIAQLERSIVQYQARILIVDNLTYLRNETEQAKDALPLMKQLKALKSKHNLSILALAHTPKRDLTQCITRNDLQGSKMLMNFCDSAFTIGESSADKNLRYLKQIKQRNTEQVYGMTNICLCNIVKPLNFLQYQFAGYGNELHHLRKPKDPVDENQVAEAMKLREEGLSLRQIGEQMGISFQKVSRLLKADDKD